jgi:hypothetical protein
MKLELLDRGVNYRSADRHLNYSYYSNRVQTTLYKRIPHLLFVISYPHP